MVNIISLDLLQEHYHARFDSADCNAFIVDISDTVSIVFEGFGSGLYVYNLKEVTPYPVSLLNTVSENRSFYSRREVQGAELAREQQGRIGWPSDQEYHEILRDNLIINSKATLDDIQRANHIMGGTAVEILKGKSTYKPTNIRAPIARVPLPPIILKTHPKEDIDIDFMFIQSAPYLLLKSVLIKFEGILPFSKISRKHKDNTKKITYKRGTSDIIRGIKKTIQLFKNRGFNIETVNGDNKFKKLENKIDAHLEICAAGQHVPRIERVV